jgi:hypothetical protein
VILCQAQREVRRSTHSVVVQAQCRWPVSQVQVIHSGRQAVIQQFIDTPDMHVWIPHGHCLQQLQAMVVPQTTRLSTPNIHPKSRIPSVTMSSHRQPSLPSRQMTFEGQNSKHRAMLMTEGASIYEWLRTHMPILIPRLRCTRPSRLTDISLPQVPLQPTTQDDRRSIAIPSPIHSSTTCFFMSTSRTAHLIV